MLTVSRFRQKLLLPLGSWIVPASKLCRQWPFLYDSDTDTLFHFNFLGGSAHQRLRHDFDKNATMFDPEIPDTAVPAMVESQSATWTLLQWSPHQLPLVHAPTTTFYASRQHSLPSWENFLLEHLEFLISEAEIWDTLCTQSCHLASDGSAPEEKGSFAWIISDNLGRRLARCKGPVQSQRISSYRAEAYGVLSVLRFLVRLRAFHIPEDMHNRDFSIHTLRCDNEGLTIKINRIKEYQKIYPNSTLDSEWDILAEIRTTILQLGAVAPTVEHILGHQDKDKPYQELPLPAQLNCDADKMAADFLKDNQDINFKNAPVFPGSGCQLQLPTGTVTHDIKQALKLARTIPPLQARLCHKHAWNQEEFNDIDWKSHGRALKRHDEHRTTLTKYLHDWLPLGKKVHTYNKKYPESCPSCDEPVEDRDHFWRCPAETRQAWKRACFRAIKQYLEKNNTAPDLQILLLDGMRTVLYHPDQILVPHHQSVHEVAAAQSALGWRQMLKGRFSKKWRLYQDRYLGHRATKRQNGTTWMTGLIDVMFKEWWKLWELRNSDRHGQDLATQTQASERQTLRELEQLYNDHKDKVGQTLQWLFAIPILTRQQMKMSALRQWINTWKPVIEESYKTALETG